MRRLLTIRQPRYRHCRFRQNCVRKILYILDDYLLPSVKETDDYRQNIEMANQAVDKHL